MYGVFELNVVDGSLAKLHRSAIQNLEPAIPVDISVPFLLDPYPISSIIVCIYSHIFIINVDKMK